MGVDERTTSRSRREEILDVAVELFLQRGFSATSMAEVAAAAGVRKPTLYHHFAGKEALFLAVVEASFADQIDRLVALSTSDLPPREKLEQAIDVIHAAIVESTAGRLAPVIAETGQRFPSIARSFHDSFMVAMHGAAVAIVREGVEGGVLAPVSEEGLEHVLFAPPVHIALSRAMFAAVEGANHFPDVAAAKEVHRRIVLDLLLADRRRG